MGGGGGGGDYEAAQQKEEAKKLAAREALNLYFGVAPTSAAPSRGSFTTTTPGRGWSQGDGEGEYIPGTTTFDERGYTAAQQASQDALDQAAKNKAARDALYTQVRTDAFNAGKRGLEEGKADAERQNKFALFAQGLNGGSEDIDQSALLGRTYSRGLLDLGARADSAKADLQSSDEQTRLGLLQSIDAGMDQGSALSSALAQLKNNGDKAAALAAGTDLGDLFGSSGLLYTKSRYAQGQQSATMPWLFGGQGGGFGNKGSTGIVSSVGGRG